MKCSDSSGGDQLSKHGVTSFGKSPMVTDVYFFFNLKKSPSVQIKKFYTLGKIFQLETDHTEKATDSTVEWLFYRLCKF